MRLSVPCNWDPALPGLLADMSCIYEMTGAMNVTPVGGGRPAMITRDATEEQVARMVEAVHANGWEFCYLLNAPCMGNMEYDVTVHSDLLAHLDWLAEIGVDTLAVTIPYLIELIKARHPGFKVRVSLIASVNTVSKATYYRALGADSITVDYMKNRDEAFLRALQKCAPGAYALLVNDQCLLHCPYRSYHYNACGHGSQTWDAQSNYYLDYSMVRCSIDKLQRPERLVMMPWIRPEDLSVYESLGFTTFKISGRHMATDAIVRAVRAYANRRFDGNLMEILNPFVAPGDARFPELSNRALDGFLEGVLSRNCETECEACAYCGTVASRAVRIADSVQIKTQIAEHQRYIDAVTHSRFMPQKQRAHEGE